MVYAAMFLGSMVCILAVAVWLLFNMVRELEQTLSETRTHLRRRGEWFYLPEETIGTLQAEALYG